MKTHIAILACLLAVSAAAQEKAWMRGTNFVLRPAGPKIVKHSKDAQAAKGTCDVITATACESTSYVQTSSNFVWTTTLRLSSVDASDGTAYTPVVYTYDLTNWNYSVSGAVPFSEFLADHFEQGYTVLLGNAYSTGGLDPITLVLSRPRK